MKRILLIFLSIGNLVAQEQIYTQSQIDSFDVYPTTRENILVYKNMLETNENLIGWEYYYAKMSRLYLSEQVYDSCYFYSKKTIDSYNSSEKKRAFDEKKLIVAYYNGARALRLHYKDYSKSLKYLLSCLDLMNKYPNFVVYMRGYVLKEIASNHMEMGDESMALKYLLQVSNDSLYLKNPKNYSPLYNQIGILYFNKNEIDSAKYFYRKALKDTIKNRRVSAHNNLGDLYRSINLIDSCVYHYKLSKEYLSKYSTKGLLLNTKYFAESNYNYVKLHDGKIIESIKGLESLLDTINNFEKFNKEEKTLKLGTLDYLIEAYQKNNQLNNALKVSKRKNDFLEEFHQQVLDENLRDLNIAYEVKEKDKSIQQLETTTEEQSEVIKQRNFISLILGGLLLSMSGIGFLVFRQRRLENKYETANLEQRLLRSQLNPHFVFNALNTVSSLANKKSENTSSYITKLSSLIRLILKNSREEFVSLEDELTSIEDYLELQSNFSQKFKYQIVIKDDIDKEETYIPPMFIQPFIENAIEHGLRGVDDGNINIDIRINETDTLLECKITDNGIGVVKAAEFKSKNGVGYESYSGKILKERLQIYSRSLNKKAKYTIQPLTKEKGTEVNVLLPYVLE